MKKILYLILTLILIVTVSSHTMIPSIDKKVAAGDTVSVNINVHQSKFLQQQNNNLYESLIKDLNSRSNLENAKANLLNKISEEYKQESYTTLDRLCNDYGYSTTNVLKMSKKDINLKFVESLLILSIVLLIIIWFIKKSIRDKLPWQTVLIFSLLIIFSLYYVNSKFQYVLSFIFNHDYLTIKELVKFF